MNNGGTIIMSLFHIPLRNYIKSEKTLRVMQLLQLQHERFLCNYSDLPISSKLMKGGNLYQERF